MKHKLVKVAGVGLVSAALSTQVQAASALDTFVTSAGTEVTSIAGAVATAMGGALAIFAIIYGGRIVLKGIRAVGK